MWLDFVASFSIQTAEGSGYYGIGPPLPYMRNLNTRLYFCSLNNNSVVFKARSPFVLKHTTSMYVCMDGWMVRMLFQRARRELFSPKNTAF